MKIILFCQSKKLCIINKVFFTLKFYKFYAELPKFISTSYLGGERLIISNITNNDFILCFQKIMILSTSKFEFNSCYISSRLYYIFQRFCHSFNAFLFVVFCSHKVVIIEGNYLLLEDDIWNDISSIFNEKW